MKITEKLRGAVRRMAGVSATAVKRRTATLPSILTTYGPRADSMPKPTPINLRRFSETPVARKAINTIKDRIAGMRWRVQARPGRSPAASSEARVQILTDNFDAPNPDDSFRSLAEQVLEDVVVGGFGAIEVAATGDSQHPLLLWPVDGATIRMKTDWDGLPGSPRYVQVTGKSGPQGTIELNDDELIYIRLNPRTHTPFGLGRLEVAFEAVNAFLGAHRYATKLASNSVVEYALWLQNLTPEHHERLIRWWQDEIEGTGRVPILSVENKPDVVYRADGNPAQGILLISWPEFTTAAGQAVAAGSISVTLGTGGRLSVALVPNQNANPANTVYAAVYQLNDGTVKTEYWSVPTTSPTTLAAVRTTLGATGTASQMVTKAYLNSALLTKADDSAVVHLGGTETINGAKQFSVVPSLPAPAQGSDAANKAYVDGAVQNASGSFVNKAGDPMTGPLVLNGDPVTARQAATKRYADLWAAVKADLIAGLVPPAELGSGTPGSTTCLLGNQTWGSCGNGGSRIPGALEPH